MLRSISPFADGYCLGAAELLQAKPIAVYCSRKVHTAAVPECQEMVRGLARQGVVLAGGWQSPLEQWLLREAAPLGRSAFIYFLSKGMEHFRPDPMIEQLLQQGRVVILAKRLRGKRISRQLVEERDRWMRTLIQRYLFCFVDPDGNTSTLIQESLDANKEVFVYNYPGNPYTTDDSVLLVDHGNYQQVLGIV